MADRSPPVLVEISARLSCGEDQARRLVDRNRNVNYEAEHGEACVDVRHQVQNNTPTEAARKELMVLEHAARIVGVDKSAWLQVEVSTEALLWVGGRWRRRNGGPV